MKTTERQTAAGDGQTKFRKTTLLPGPNGEWGTTEVREGTFEGGNQGGVSEERVMRPDSEGKLSVVERTTTKKSTGAGGERRETTEVYSKSLVNGESDNSLELSRKTTTVERSGMGNSKTTEQLVEERTAANPSDGLRPTQKSIDIADGGPGGSTREKRTVISIQSNGQANAVWVDTRQKDNGATVEVDTRPKR